MATFVDARDTNPSSKLLRPSLLMILRVSSSLILSQNTICGMKTREIYLTARRCQLMTASSCHVVDLEDVAEIQIFGRPVWAQSHHLIGLQVMSPGNL